jgi:hypothetical protein
MAVLLVLAQLQFLVVTSLSVANRFLPVQYMLLELVGITWMLVAPQYNAVLEHGDNIYKTCLQDIPFHYTNVCHVQQENTGRNHHPLMPVSVTAIPVLTTPTLEQTLLSVQPVLLESIQIL